MQYRTSQNKTLGSAFIMKGKAYPDGISLELHEEVVAAGATVHPKQLETALPRILHHRLQHLPCLHTPLTPCLSQNPISPHRYAQGSFMQTAIKCIALASPGRLKVISEMVELLSCN